MIPAWEVGRSSDFGTNGGESLNYWMNIYQVYFVDSTLVSTKVMRM